MRRGRDLTSTLRAALVLAGICTLFLPAQARGQAATAGLEDRVDARTLELVRPALEAAARDSLPLEALRAKVLEGSAKNRPPELIAQVATRLADDLRATRTELRNRLPDAPISGGELVAAALARRQGVPVEAVAEVWTSRPEGTSLEIPVTVLAELVRRGIPAQSASALMRQVLSTGVPLDRAAQIPGRFDRAAQPGVAPPQALERALRDLDIPGPPAGRGPGEGDD
ncbi:MAG: hypothetical protein WD995_00320 [Gemmatimonadota bacterium]